MHPALIVFAFVSQYVFAPTLGPLRLERRLPFPMIVVSVPHGLPFPMVVVVAVFVVVIVAVVVVVVVGVVF